MRQNEVFGDFRGIHLAAAKPSVALMTKDALDGAEAPEGLSERERAAFVGVERRYVRLEGNELVVSIHLSRPLAEGVQASIYVFGYRADRPFGQMAKVHIQVGELSCAAYDQTTRLARPSVSVTRQPRRIEVRIPLETMENPQRILTSARTYLGELPLDWAAWRTLELSPAVKTAGR